MGGIFPVGDVSAGTAQQETSRKEVYLMFENIHDRLGDIGEGLPGWFTAWSSISCLVLHIAGTISGFLGLQLVPGNVECGERLSINPLG